MSDVFFGDPYTMAPDASIELKGTPEQYVSAMMV